MTASPFASLHNSPLQIIIPLSTTTNIPLNMEYYSTIKSEYPRMHADNQ
jgi:hypothetical protein